MIGRVLRSILLLLLPAVLATVAKGADAIQEAALQSAVARVAPSVVQIETVGGTDRVGDFSVGTGPTTGLVVDPQGYIVSSSINFAHTPSGILVRLPGGKRLGATLIATDHNLKIALLKVESDAPLPVPSFVKPDSIRVGQWAIAVGRVFDPQQPNVAVGIVSATNRVWGKALQTDTAVSPNNYGGPLVNVQGDVMGVLVPMSPESDEEEAGIEWYDSGIGFAVPVDRLLAAISRLRGGEDLRAGRVGMTLKKSVAMSGPPIVTSVLPNSPAEKAGLKKGDRIVRVGERNIGRSADIKYELAARYAGDSFDMLVRRGDETVECHATLTAKLEPYRCPVLGILPEREEASDDGALVRYVLPGSPAASQGIEPRDRIVKLDGESIADVESLRGRIARFEPGEQVTLEIVSDGNRKQVKVPLGTADESLPEKVPARPIDPEAAAGREVPLALPQWKNEISVYLPKGYSSNHPHGLLVWLCSPAETKGKLDRWKKHADSRGLVVVLIEPSSTERWWPKELELVRDVLRLCRKRFEFDSHRLVVGGHEGGGTLAYRAATLERETLTGCVVVDARLAGPPLVDHPENRFGLLLGRAEKSTLAERLGRSAEVLRRGGLPVTVFPCDASGGQLSDRDLSAIARWMDLLDQI